MAVVPRIGTDFAGYRIEALLGRGGMSVVYRAENARLGNKVALKLLAEELANDESFRERFVRESRTAATLNHPNIVTIYDAGDEDGVLYIAMRYVESDLKEFLKREGPLSVARTLSVVAQIGSALDAAHARGLLHRDVKPANILLELASEPGGMPPIAYLADFGLTKHLESRSGITASGQFVGTIDYMSPEQIEGRDVDGRTDVYSLGCVTFECLAGLTPFRRETEVAVLWAHMRDDPPPVTEVRNELPTQVDAVLAKAVAKPPDERYANCADFVANLRAALEGTPTGLTHVATPTSRKPPDERVERPSRRRLLLPPALGARFSAAAAESWATSSCETPRSASSKLRPAGLRRPNAAKRRPEADPGQVQGEGAADARLPGEHVCPIGAETCSGSSTTRPSRVASWTSTSIGAFSPRGSSSRARTSGGCATADCRRRGRVASHVGRRPRPVRETTPKDGSSATGATGGPPSNGPTPTSTSTRSPTGAT